MALAAATRNARRLLSGLLALPARALSDLRAWREFRPHRYWERRAPELIETYDNPQLWAEKGWLRGDVEESTVPELLQRAGAASVLVVGAGCGREYAYLQSRGFELQGFDISSTMVAEARKRFPQICTTVDSVVGAHRRQAPADGVLSSAVLAHVPPREIQAAVESLKKLATRIIILREKTLYTVPSRYQWQHDYEALLAPWKCVYRTTTDIGEGERAELIAWEPPGKT